MFINHSSKEVTAKVVYYGPGLSGKTTNLQYIFSITNPKTRGELISIETEIERTLFFDLLPINVGLINGYQTKFQLYTVPGQVFYDSTRKLVLKGADGIVFVADSQELMKTANLESFENLKKNLLGHKLDINDIPLVFQYNKRDLNNTLPVEELDRIINHDLKRPYFSAVATDGDGVVDTLRAISGLILQKIKGLLDQSDREKEPKTATVQFDTDKKYNVFDHDNVPLKKIHAGDLENPGVQLDPLVPEKDTAPPPAPETPPSPVPAEDEDLPFPDAQEPLNDDRLKMESPLPSNPNTTPEPQIEEEEMLTVETLGPMDEYRDLEELVLGEDISEIEELPDVEEIQLGEDLEELDLEDSPPVDSDTFEPMELLTDQKDYDTNELFENNKLDNPENPAVFDDLPEAPKNEEPVAFELGEITDGSLSEVDELVDLQDIRFDDEDSEFHNPAVDEKPSPPSPESPPVEASVPKVTEPQPQPQPQQQPQPPAPEPVKSLDDIPKEDSAKNKPKPAKKPGAPFMTPSTLELFDKLQDKTRVTVIRKIQAKDLEHLLIDVKGTDSSLLDSVKVDITPDTKKVTLIIDVKK